MDELRELAKMVTRAFYSDSQVIVVDLLTRYPILKEEELVFQMKMNLNDVRKAVARLRNDKIVKTESRGEIKRMDGRIQQKLCYYIDYKCLYDSIKYRIWKIQKDFRERGQTERSDRDFVCPHCGSRFSQLEATSFGYGSDMLFRCPYHRPGEDFYLELTNEQQSESHVKLTGFITAIEPIVALLKKIEGTKIPAHVPGAQETGDGSMQNGNSKTSGSPKKEIGVNMDDTVFQQQVVVDIQETHAAVAQANAAADFDKERKRKQNALPVWHQKSTVVAETTESAKAISAREIADKDTRMVDASVVGSTISAPAEDQDGEAADILGYYEKYYETYAAQKEKTADTTTAVAAEVIKTTAQTAEEAVDEAVDEDEDDDDFEEVT